MAYASKSAVPSKALERERGKIEIEFCNRKERKKQLSREFESDSA